MGQSADAASMTPARASNFFAGLVDGRMLFNSLRVYRSALSNWWSEAMLGADGPNPLMHEAVSRVLKGAEKTLLPFKLARAAASSPPIALTPELIERLRPVLSGDDSHSLMRFAAAITGTYALLRPGELLGSAQHRDRALRAEQITFYADATQSQPVGLIAPGVAIDRYEPPDHFTIAPLGITKADPFALNGPIDVAGAPAVCALWQWMHTRRDLAPKPEDTLFQVPLSPPLSCSDLTRAIERAIESAEGTPARVTGKCFRKGGASGLLASGANRPDIAAQGRWRTAAMVETYASAGAKRKRALAVSRSMAPVPRSSSLPGSSVPS